ncbi:unnamed protein product [Lactuca virosa]|uniref:F-box domain-containing protein n=1 Tax=Lactuca virosa TaxID=75947 RepID=A0AAU9PCF2_9ASTR|nr:unnamed protein product [Lactuca virosa]
MKRLPVKSLVQFRCVSKAWKSLIDSSEFIAAHSLFRHNQQQHLLISYQDPIDKENYVCYIDDDTFPQHRPLPTLPLYTTKMVVLWNPSIRISIVVIVLNNDIVGFGVCPVTNDPKIVSITQSSDDPNIGTGYRCKVMVYTLSTGKWRSLSNNLPTESIQDPRSLVVTDMFIYWHVGLTRNMIMSFDVTNEKFEVIELPDSLAIRHPMRMYCSKLCESLAMLHYREDTCTVWMMEHGAQRAFTKLFTIKTPDDFIVGLRKSGVPILQVTDDDPDDINARYKLAVYEPNSEHNNVFEICGTTSWFNLNSYVETLLLLGRSDCNSY